MTLSPGFFFDISFSYTQQKIKRILQNTGGVVHYKQLKHTNLVGKVVKGGRCTWLNGIIYFYLRKILRRII